MRALLGLWPRGLGLNKVHSEFESASGLMVYYFLRVIDENTLNNHWSRRSKMINQMKTKKKGKSRIRRKEKGDEAGENEEEETKQGKRNEKKRYKEEEEGGGREKKGETGEEK